MQAILWQEWPCHKLTVDPDTIPIHQLAGRRVDSSLICELARRQAGSDQHALVAFISDFLAGSTAGHIRLIGPVTGT